MKRIIIPILALGLALSACVEEAPEDPGWELNNQNNANNQNNQNNQNNVNNQNNKNNQEGPELVGMFVSGHLGNYMDCPDKGYDPANEDAGAGFAPGEGDCAEDGCGILNCETAQLTIRLENIGLGQATGLKVTTIEIFGLDGTRLAELPITAIHNAEDDGPVQEGLSAGEAMMLRIDYMGPAQPWEFFDEADGSRRSYSGTLKLTIESENHDPVVIESSELYVIDSIAT